jgi:hypothetical protein
VESVYDCASDFIFAIAGLETHNGVELRAGQATCLGEGGSAASSQHRPMAGGHMGPPLRDYYPRPLVADKVLGMGRLHSQIEKTRESFDTDLNIQRPRPHVKKNLNWEADFFAGFRADQGPRFRGDASARKRIAGRSGDLPRRPPCFPLFTRGQKEGAMQ